LEFKRVYALEKIHGTSAHINWNNGKLSFSSRGATHSAFVALFDEEYLRTRFTEVGCEKVRIYGEAYGGKLQGMRNTYGPDLKFVVFEVQIDGYWLDVPTAEAFAKSFNLEFVAYDLVSTDTDTLTAERNKPSVQAARNGCGSDKKREGIVLRPPIELTKNNGERLMAKYKNDDFAETKTPRSIDVDKQQLLTEAKEIADEWVTEMRLTHVLDKNPQVCSIENMRELLNAMVEDIRLESTGEIVLSVAAIRAINSATAVMFKRRLQSSI
jgi:hypothetical protein